MAKTRLQTIEEPAHADAGPSGSPPGADNRVFLPIASIDANPWNPRRFAKRPDPDDQALTASIAQHGVLENLLVRPMPGGRHQLIFGERRLRCAKAAGLAEVPTIVREMDDHEARVLTVTENLHRKQLHFLEEAAGVAALVDEHWTVERIAAKLDKPLSWVARRRRLLNLTPAWQKLAQAQEDWTATWGAAHFEQIAILEPAAQDELLTRDPWQLERCETVRDVARLIGSRTLDLSTFAWPLDDAELDPVAGACAACPFRSSRHPGLFDGQEFDDDPSPGRRRKPQKTDRAEPSDRCLNPLCAANKGMLFVERKKAEVTARHGSALLIDDGHSSERVAGALLEHHVVPAKKGTDGAVPAIVANGPHLGQVKWVKPLPQLKPPAPTRAQGDPPQRKSLAERQEQKWRQRKVHAIGLLKTALIEQPPPPLSTSVRLAVVFGTAQTLASSTHGYDTALPRVAPDIDRAEERRRMLGRRAGTTENLTHLDGPGALADGPADELTTTQTKSPEGPHWQTFDALENQEAACGDFLWARTLAVMLDRMTPDGDWRHVDIAWHEAERVAPLVGLAAQTFLDQATVALPNPKSWAREQATPRPDAPTPRHKEASRLPR
jgi:ParB/RepB/Spo0J family partition protein